jgi:hypothetical protein
LQDQKYCELEDRASLVAETDAMKKLEARARVAAEIERMKEEGKALVLSDEEERMLRSFRSFKKQCRAGSVFKWQTRPPEGVTLTTETGLITDPQNVS